MATSSPRLPAYLDGPVDDQVERFLEHWLGPPTAGGTPAQARPDVDFPDVLRRHHETRSRWAIPLNRMCRLVHPSDVGTGAVAPPQVTVFLEEEQGVQEWGFDAGRQVWTREVEDGEPWVTTGADLATFLVGSELVEAAVGNTGPAGAASPRARGRSAAASRP